MFPNYLFFISLLISCFIFTHSYHNIQCLDHQNHLLLQFKNELIFNSSLSTKLVQWNLTNNCCHWHGVECDGAGQVVSLQLNHESISGGIRDTSSLFGLKYLEKLNLAYNNFNSTVIPKGIKHLKYLTHLNLAYAGFSGQVPLEISSLKRLVSLNICYYWYIENPKLKLPNLEMLLQNLTGFRKLYLDGVDITSSRERSNWSHIISLYLPNITILSLAFCSLKGSFPDKIFQIPTLQHLDLSENQQLSGSLPPFPHSGSLKSLRLTYTNLSGSIPSSIGNLKTLSEIDLSYCGLGGPIPSSFANLTQLTFVNLEGNSITGKIPNSLFGLPSLHTLDLYNNNFTGVIEEFPTINVSKIVSLDLSGNRLEGPIPDSFFQLQSLEILLLDENLFDGSFQLEKIQSFANLTTLDLSRNNLSVHFSNDNWSSYGLPMLSGLGLGSCNLHDFPHFMKHYPNHQLQKLDLSNNRISGVIPSWVWGTQLRQLNLSFNLFTHVQKPFNIPPSLEYLDLQSNQLKEELHLPFPPNITYFLQYLSLANNSLSGSIPTSLCRATNLEALDLYMNKLSGTMPSCLLDGTMDLTMLDLGQNNFSGHIPDSLHLHCNLQYLNLSNNTLQGKIPKSLGSCKWLQLMNLGNNLINDTFPCIMSPSLQVLVLRSNRFHGEVKCHSNDTWSLLQIIDISSNNFSGNLKSINFSSWRGMVQGSYPQRERTELRFTYSRMAGVRITVKGLEVEIVKIFPDFTTIDFSSNNFHGEIPMAIGDLSSLRLLNFSHNALNGIIPKSFGKLGELESLDLSRNQLTGHIPTELSRLTFLSVLNVSYNRLNGEIPKGSQLQTFSADFFLGNPGLCGFNLNISCTSPTDDDDDDDDDEEKERKKREIEWEYVSTPLGYVVGLGSFLWVLIFCRSFRYRYFGKIDEIVEDMFDARDRRRRRRRSHARRRREQ